MSDRLTTAFAADLEVRSDGRTVAGIAVPFDVETQRGQVTEVVRFGAFTRTIAERGDRVKFMAQHNHSALPLGRATVLREDPTGLYGEFRVSATTAGDEVLSLITDGALDSLSIGFKPVRDRVSPDGSLVERLEVALYEVSAVAFPQFDGHSKILAVRSEPDPLVISVVDARTRLHRGSTPGLSRFEARRRFWSFG